MIRLLCTDMDRTLLPNGEQAVSPEALGCLRSLIAAAGLKLAYVTGRDLQRVLDAIDEFEVPVPDFIVGDVGSSVYRHDGERWVPFDEWRSRISQDWQGRAATDVHALIGDDARLIAQEADRQHACKQSYYLARDEDQPTLQAELAEKLEAAGFHSALIMSDDPEANCGLLDVLPATATKRHGIEFLRDMLTLDDAQVMFAGDSGNDLDALSSHIPAVLVANAEESVRKAAVRDASALGNERSLYLATGNLSLPGGGVLNGCYSAGIVEGLLHFHPSLQEHLGPTVQ